MDPEPELDAMTAAWQQGEQFQRDVALATEGMSDDERATWCAEMDAYRGLGAER